MNLKIQLPTPEELEQISLKVYNEQRDNVNNYSYWYEKVKDYCNVVNSKYYNLSYDMWSLIGDLYEKIYQLPLDEFYKTNEYNKWSQYIKSLLNEDSNYYNKRKIYSFKTGTFSNKFDFNTSIGYIQEFPYKILNILFRDTEVEADGCSQIVIRDFIPFNVKDTPTIYNGMPLQCEFRVFYDFDKHKLLYTHNYWDYNYCKNYLSPSDNIVFKNEQQRLDTMYKDNLDRLIQTVNKEMKNINLQGIWSIDYMLNDITDTFYLIDMAVGSKSAYWDPNLIK